MASLPLTREEYSGQSAINLCFFAEGVSSIGSVLEIADSYGIIKQSGSWILYGDDKLGQGRENARVFLKENPKILEEIEDKIRQHGAQIAPLTATQSAQ